MISFWDLHDCNVITGLLSLGNQMLVICAWGAGELNCYFGATKGHQLMPRSGGGGRGQIMEPWPSFTYENKEAVNGSS